jgi:hypothetical protein
MRTSRCSVDVRPSKGSHRTLRVSRGFLQANAHTVALILELLEAMLLHEREQLLDFREINSPRLPLWR